MVGRGRAQDRAVLGAAACARHRQRQLHDPRTSRQSRAGRAIDGRKAQGAWLRCHGKAGSRSQGESDDVEQFSRKVGDRGKATVAVLYYAGHGLESDGVNYLVPVNAEIKRRSDVAPQSLSVKRIADRLASAGNGLNILIRDACRDNPFPESVAPRGVTGLVPKGVVLGVFIASATGSGKSAFDGDDGHSPYTRALAEAIISPGEKLEDILKLEDIFKT